jgi:hypothetical protein
MKETAEMLSSVKMERKSETMIQYLMELTGGKLLDSAVSVTQPDADGSLLDTIINATEADKRSSSVYGKKMTEDDLNRVGAKILDAIISSPGANLPSAKDTLWGAVNGVTYYVDHVAGRSGQDARHNEAWFGQRDKMKTQAVNLAVEYAKKEGVRN